MVGQQQLRPTFSRTNIGTFFQEEPCFGNPYLQDTLLQNYLKRQLPPQVFLKVDSDLERFGVRICDEIDALGKECNVNHPVLQHYDAWGRRVDRIVTCPAWKKMKQIAAEEGLIAEAYDRKYSNWSRLYQVAKLYLYSLSSGLFTSPLAMTDGAAKVIKSIGFSGPLEKAYKHLTSRDPKIFWTSGQWMTERKGGSDVAGGTETVAREQPDGSYRLYGFKWFTSATDADMALTLGRVMDAQGNTLEGSKGLSLFYLEMLTEDGRLNNIEIQRLKDKLGTRQLPTAELLLDGTKALKISEEGRGVATIANMLTIARVHNSVSAAAVMRRIVNLARDYASKRFVFGKFIRDHPLHMQTMARMEIEARGAFLLVMEVARLLGLEENHMASEVDLDLLRLLTPVVKLYTGKQAVAVVSEGLECFGGQGYMEDTGLPGMLRDAQVLSIWEGTTNILSLDILRAIAKTGGRVLTVFSSAVKSKLEAASGIPELKQTVKAEQIALGKLEEFIHKAATQEASFVEVAARDLSYSLARIYAGALFVEHATWKEATPLDIYAAVRWCEQELCPVATAEKAGSYNAEMVAIDTALVYDGSPFTKGKL